MCCYRACFFQSLEPNLSGSVSQWVFLFSLAMWANPSLASYPLLFPYADGVSLYRVYPRPVGSIGRRFRLHLVSNP